VIVFPSHISAGICLGKTYLRQIEITVCWIDQTQRSANRNCWGRYESGESNVRYIYSFLPGKYILLYKSYSKYKKKIKQWCKNVLYNIVPDTGLHKSLALHVQRIFMTISWRTFLFYVIEINVTPIIFARFFHLNFSTQAITGTAGYCCAYDVRACVCVCVCVCFHARCQSTQHRGQETCPARHQRWSFVQARERKRTEIHEVVKRPETLIPWSRDESLPWDVAQQTCLLRRSCSIQRSDQALRPTAIRVSWWDRFTFNFILL